MAQKRWWWGGGILLALLGGGSWLLYSYWQNVTAQPDWYTEEAIDHSPSATFTGSPISSSPVSPSPINASPIAPTPQPSVTPLNPSASASPSGSPTSLPRGVSQLKTQLRGDTLRAGAMVDLSDLEEDTVGKKGQGLRQLLTLMPQLQGQRVYLGIQGQIVEVKGQRQLSPDSKLAIGKVELPLEEVASQLQIPRAQLDSAILKTLNLNLQNPPRP